MEQDAPSVHETGYQLIISIANACEYRVAGALKWLKNEDQYKAWRKLWDLS